MNTRTHPCHQCNVLVSPRVRGEHRIVSAKSGPKAGSSPRARGTHGVRVLVHFHHRFIPACAGNTGYVLSRSFSSSVHPRVRGEHRESTPHQLPIAGSSPRARGTRLCRLRYKEQVRFIPACAGNTSSLWIPVTRQPVHPRVRGEHTVSGCCRLNVGGSSPRARGTPYPDEDNAPRWRFIPACAGNTLETLPAEAQAAVHPRVRGEHGCLNPGV